jgi:glutamate dehydrogenase/leucine dehydrogenase
VTVSYFEWVQNLQQFRWPAAQVEEELERTMDVAYDAVRAESSRERISLRIAAYMIGIRRVAAATRLRGLD